MACATSSTTGRPIDLEPDVPTLPASDASGDGTYFLVPRFAPWMRLTAQLGAPAKLTLNDASDKAQLWHVTHDASGAMAIVAAASGAPLHVDDDATDAVSSVAMDVWRSGDDVGGGFAALLRASERALTIRGGVARIAARRELTTQQWRFDRAPDVASIDGIQARLAEQDRETIRVGGRVFAMRDIAKFAPLTSFFVHERAFPCSVEWALGDAQLRRTMRASRTFEPEKRQDDARFTPIVNPSTDDITAHVGTDYYVAVGASRRRGQPLSEAPLYVTVEPLPASVKLHFVYFYAFQGGQPIRSLLSLDPVDAIMGSYGMHEGDIEQVVLEVDPSLQRVLRLTVAAHGDAADYAPREVDFVEGMHPIVRIAFLTHGTRNNRGFQRVDSDPQIVISGVAELMNLHMYPGIVWKPWTTGALRFIGTDTHGVPLNARAWVKFAGRIGAHWTSRYAWSRAADWSPLSGAQRAWIDAVITAAQLFSLVPREKAVSDGTAGFATRSYIQERKPDAR